MVGLIIKDMMNLKKQILIYVFFIIFYGIFSFANGNDQLFWFAIIIIGIMTPITSIAFDERVKWDKFALTMPIKRKDLVLSKYILSYMTVLLSILVYLIYLLVLGRTIDQKLLFTTGGIVAICILYQSIFLPIIFKFGTEKGRIIFFIGCAVPYILVYLTNKTNFLKAPSQELIDFLPVIVSVGTVVISILSILISNKIYKKKDF